MIARDSESQYRGLVVCSVAEIVQVFVILNQKIALGVKYKVIGLV